MSKKTVLQLTATIVSFSILWIGKLSLFIGQAQAQTEPWSGVCVGSDNPTDPAYSVATIRGFQCLIGNILSVFITIIGLAGFVMLIYGSIKYMLSGGQAKGTESAKQTLTYAVIGLVVALSAFFIINIISAFTGVDTILNFSIPEQIN